MDKKRQGFFGKRSIALVVFVILLAFTTLFYSLPNQNNDNYCDQFEAVNTETGWIVESAIGIDIDIQWQRSILASDPTFVSGNDGLVFYQGPTDCHFQSYIVAFDANTGSIRWTYDARLIRNIARIDDDYIAIGCCMEVIRLNDVGDEVWRSEMIPARILRPNVYIVDDFIYFPISSQTHVLNIENGSEELSLNIENALAIYEDYALINPVGATLEVIEIDSMNVVWSARLPVENTLSNYDVFRFEDVVVVAFGSSEMTAYNIEDGEELWTIDDNLQAFPVSVGRSIIVYSEDNVLAWHDIFTGELIAEVVLTRIAADEDMNTAISIPAVLSISEDYIFVYHDDSRELIALNYNFPE